MVPRAWRDFVPHVHNPSEANSNDMSHLLVAFAQRRI
jgi:hypothetical protein